MLLRSVPSIFDKGQCIEAATHEQQRKSPQTQGQFIGNRGQNITLPRGSYSRMRARSAGEKHGVNAPCLWELMPATARYSGGLFVHLVWQRVETI